MTTPAAHFHFTDAPLGFFRWLLHEAVRANPLYVISAALLAYAVQQLIAELDPQVGMLGGVLAILALLHAYEIAVLVVATVVLKRRAHGGLDMHGLLIVAGLYLGSSFIALDELIAIRPWLGLALAAATLVVAAIKLAWYARLPGVFLPAGYRHAVLSILGAHTLAPLLSSREIFSSLSPLAAQGLAWWAGWVSLAAILRLIAVEFKALGAPSAQPQSPADPNADPLATRWCGGWALGVVTLTAITHLFVGDWIADRPIDVTRLYPALTVMAAAVVLVRWRLKRRLSYLELAMIAAPLWMLQQLGQKFPTTAMAWRWELLCSPEVQLWVASIVFYIILARVTGQRRYYAGLAGPLAVPACIGTWKACGMIPHFRAWATAGLGFATLALGMCVSLYREHLLRTIRPARHPIDPDVE